jgi:hypothetical protein
MWAREGAVRLLGLANSHSACSRRRLRLLKQHSTTLHVTAQVFEYLI